ncbi:zinc finger MYM-type protein 1-like [Aphis craccivora]|uniref:Zinc finger MYM-type protein 1-like n=1 Tax=Aphis craccivora TaxID=307492 RepID=A0A6G0VMQ9_APHCR|nr:zinc finger MYM-type protein 1-like [Aphis craccivora]
MVAKNCLKQINKDFDLMHFKNIIEKNVYPNINKLLQVVLTLPISSATCERSFSALHKIKTRLIVKSYNGTGKTNRFIHSQKKDRRINLI